MSFMSSVLKKPEGLLNGIVADFKHLHELTRAVIN